MGWRERFRLAWMVLYTGVLPVQHPKFAALVASPLSDAAKRAVEKVALDPSFHPKMSDLKRKEALQWTGVYYLDRAGAPQELWETGFLIEYWVGVLTGRL